MICRASCARIGVCNVAAEGVSPGAGAIDNQGAVKTMNSQRAGCIAVNKDGITATKIKGTRGIRAKVHLKVGQSAAHDEVC